jgi:hypothetical protein
MIETLFLFIFSILPVMIFSLRSEKRISFQLLVFKEVEIQMRKGEAVWNLTKEVRDKILEGERRGMDPLVRT